jgi:LacI family transcriptional regulator
MRRVAVLAMLYQNFDQRVLRGIAAYMRKVGTWSLYVEEELIHKMPDFRRWNGDGIIVNFDDRRAATAAMKFGKPVVGYGGGLGWYHEGCGIPYLETDDAGIARLAAEHLLERGLKHFAFCGYPPTRMNPWVARRAAGFIGRLAEAGYQCPEFKGHYTTSRHWDKLQQELVAWLRTLPTPVGLMACYDARARHVLEACNKLGLRVPDDVALIGVDNDPIMCELANPPLSSVEQGCVRLGLEAATLLDRMMDGQRPERTRYCIAPAGLAARRSTEMVAVDDPQLAAALLRIRERACAGLTVNDLVGELAVSRSTLDHLFKGHLGGTVHSEIQRVRLERAKQLLAQTDLPLKVVAQRSGYATEQYLAAVLRKYAATTPAQYRRDAQRVDENLALYRSLQE